MTLAIRSYIKTCFLGGICNRNHLSRAFNFTGGLFLCFESINTVPSNNLVMLILEAVNFSSEIHV